MAEAADQGRAERAARYMRGAMTRDERAAFEGEMRDDPDLRAEIAVLSAARRAFAEDAAAAPAGGWDRLSAAIDAERPRAANNNRRFFWMAAQAAVVAVVSVLAWQTFVAPDGGDAPVYGTATAPAEGATLQVVFAEDAPLGAVAALLAETGAEVTGGPGALGVFHLSFADEAAREAALAILDRRTDLVTSIFGR